MLQTKKVLVVCPSAAATSVFVAQKLKELFTKEKMAVDLKICTTREVENTVRAYKPHLIVVNGKLIEGSAGTVPVIQGLPFLTGLNKTQAETQIIEILKEE